jgi:ABC-type phosphate transport system auxiliary subunit
MSAAPKPGDLLEPGNFPDDLQWVPAHYKLHPSDPVYMLIAWHWRRVKQSEDTLRATLVELKQALDDRIGHLAEAAETVAGVNDALADVQVALEEKPAELAALLETKLTQPVADTLTRLQALAQTLAPLARSFQTSQRRQFLAMFLAGITVGVLAAVIVLFA